MPEKPLSNKVRKPLQCDHCGKVLTRDTAIKVTDDTGTFPVCRECRPKYPQ